MELLTGPKESERKAKRLGFRKGKRFMTERYAHLAPGYLKDAVNLLTIPGSQVTPKVTPTEAKIS